MRKEGIWATQIEIAAAASYLGMPYYLHSQSSNKAVLLGVLSATNTMYVFSSYHSIKEHFVKQSVST